MASSTLNYNLRTSTKRKREEDANIALGGRTVEGCELVNDLLYGQIGIEDYNLVKDDEGISAPTLDREAWDQIKEKSHIPVAIAQKINTVPQADIKPMLELKRGAKLKVNYSSVDSLSYQDQHPIYLKEMPIGVKNPPIKNFGARLFVDKPIKEIMKFSTKPRYLKPTILSYVASINVGIKFDLHYIAKSLDDVEYNPSKFAPLIVRIIKPRASVLVYRSGKVVISGCRSEDDLKTAAEIIVRKLNGIGLKAILLDITVQNISAECKLGFRVHLEKMTKYCKSVALLEVQMFPGLIYRMARPNVKFILFHTGSVLMTGAKSAAELNEAFDNFYPIAKPFIKF